MQTDTTPPSTLQPSTLQPPKSAAQPPPQLPPLSLYVHFPWCVRKCPYCDFNSHTLHGALPEAQYVEALLRDLALSAEAAQGRELQSIFLGGGTPSLFSPAALAKLLRGVRELLEFPGELEATLEANPGTIERGRFDSYKRDCLERLGIWDP